MHLEFYLGVVFFNGALIEGLRGEVSQMSAEGMVKAGLISEYSTDSALDAFTLIEAFENTVSVPAPFVIYTLTTDSGVIVEGRVIDDNHIQERNMDQYPHFVERAEAERALLAQGKQDKDKLEAEQNTTLVKHELY